MIHASGKGELWSLLSFLDTCHANDWHPRHYKTHCPFNIAIKNVTKSHILNSLWAIVQGVKNMGVKVPVHVYSSKGQVNI